MASVLSSLSSLMGSVLSSFCSPSLLSLSAAPPPSPRPPHTPQIKSDVFLSFRGEDTRDNFTSHLCKALVDKQIITFIDDKLNKGDDISPSLLKAIEESQIAIIIFFKDYASSSWCLEELVKILECRKNHGQIVIPVFYKIEPSGVRNQTGNFEAAIMKHQSSKNNSRQVQKWKDALKLAGSISGFDSRVVKGLKKLRGSLWMSNTGDIHLPPDAFANMRNLRFLQIYIRGCWRDNNNKIHVQQDLKYLLTKLRYFEWQFDHLKEIDLYSSQKLIRFPDLTAPKLERLNLEECTHLIEMPSSFQHLTQLMDLCLSSCKNLASVPQLPKYLHDRDVINCSKLQRLPELPNNLEGLNFRECSSLIEIPSSIQHVTKPNSLGLWGCSKLQRLPELPNNLKELYLVRCSSLIEISSSFKHLSKLGHLTIMCCESLTNIPDLSGLKSLKYLAIEYCSKLKMLPEFPNSIETLLLKKIPIEEWPPSLLPPSIDLLHDLRHLCLTECEITEIPDSVCCLTSLQYLSLASNNFERIPETIMNLSNLSFLCISYCWRLKVLPKLPWAEIVALNCISLQELSCPSFPNDFFALSSSQFVPADFINCFKLDRNSIDSFVKDAQQELQAQSPSYRQVYIGKKPPLVICYPDSEIPERFSFQCIGSFINVKLPQEWIDYNSLCFALCAVVSFPDQFEFPDSCSAHVTYKCYVKSEEGSHNRGRMRGLLGGFYNTAECSTRSSHVIVGFGFHLFRELHDNEFTFQFDCSCKVEKCGVHLMFGKHLEKSDQNEKVDEPYSEESEEEDEYSEESEEEEEDESHIE